MLRTGAPFLHPGNTASCTPRPWWRTRKFRTWDSTGTLRAWGITQRFVGSLLGAGWQERWTRPRSAVRLVMVAHVTTMRLNSRRGVVGQGAHRRTRG